MEERLFSTEELAKFDDYNAQKIAVFETDKTSAAMWCLEPGQEVFKHTHPNADDVWICLEGESGYYYGADGEGMEIKKGSIIQARAGQMHGMKNTGNDRFVFVGICGPVPAEVVRL